MLLLRQQKLFSDDIYQPTHYFAQDQYKVK